MCIRLSQKYDFYHIKAATAEFRTREDMSSATNIKRADFLRTLKLIHERYSHLATDPHILKAQKKVEEAMAREVEIKQLSSSTMEYGRLHQYRFAKEFIKDKKVLVLGSGKGYGCFILSEDAESVICIDKDERNIRYASSNYIKENLEFIKGPLIDVPVKEEKTFDVIVCFEALEQVEERHELMKEVKRLLKDDGIFIVSSSNKYVSSGQTAYEKPLRLKELSFDEFKSLLKKHFKNTLIYGQKVFPSSNIFPLFRSSVATRDYTIEKGDKAFLFVPHERKEARYLIAVSSDGHIKDITGNSYLVDISETLFKLKDRQIRSLEIDSREKDSHITDLERTLKEKDLHIGNLGNSLDQKSGQIRNLEAALTEEESRISNLEAKVREEESRISNLEATAREKESHISNLEVTVKDKDAHLTNLEAAVREKQATLNDIYNSHGWKALRIYYSLRNKIFPINTKRRLFGKILFKLITNPKGIFKKKITSLSPMTKQTQNENSEEQNDIVASVIIVNYENEKLTVDCVKSLLSNDYPRNKYEVLVVDNGSTNYSYGLLLKELGIYENITMLKSERNVGFSSGCNIGIKASRGKYIILLNNDTLVPKDWLSKFIGYAELNKDIGILGTKLLFADKEKVINNAGSYLTDKGDAGDIGFREEDVWQYDYQREVFSICGANMLIKRVVLNNIGLFDNKFFLYYEDSDLCYRARLGGYRILYLPEPSVSHHHAASSGEWSPLFSFHVFRNKLFLHIKNSSVKFLITVFIGYLKQLLKEIIILRTNRKIHGMVLLSVIKNLPYLINNRLRIRFLIKEVSDNSIYKYLERIPGRKRDASRVKNIIIYNRYLDTLGGGEFSAVLLAKALSELFTNAKINIVTFDKDKARWGKVEVRSTAELEEAFSIKLPNRVCVNRIKTRVQASMERLENSSEESPGKLCRSLYKLHRLLLHHKLKGMSKKCDLFINHSFMDEFIPRAKVSLYLCMFPRVYRNKDFIINYHKVIGISEFTIKHINKRWECKGELLYPFGLENVPNYNDFDRRENIIVSVGRFFTEGHNKRQDVIIEAFKMLKQRYKIDGWKLVLIGRYSEKDIDLVEKLKVASKGYEIKILTDLSENDKSSLLEKCKIYVHATGYGLSEEDFPDLMEHFGISVVEAKIRGLVPIVVDKGGLKELVKDGVDGFRFDTIDDLAEKLYMVIKNQNLLRELSLNAYKNSIERFNYSIFSGHFKLILKDMFRFENG
ncbi:MAG TPA: glycosyltransferase [Syntrophales bacterium]|nr:glycosyltransferase [Syntrophales bacterium]